MKMRKTAFVSMLSFVFLALSSICTWLLSSFSPPTPWIPLGIGFVILIISGAICLKFDLYTVTPYIVFVLNLFALSLCMKAWYDFRGCQVSLHNMLLVSLIVNAVLWIYYLLLFVPFFRKHFKSFTGLYICSDCSCFCAYPHTDPDDFYRRVLPDYRNRLSVCTVYTQHLFQGAL